MVENPKSGKGSEKEDLITMENIISFKFYSILEDLKTGVRIGCESEGLKRK